MRNIDVTKKIGLLALVFLLVWTGTPTAGAIKDGEDYSNQDGKVMTPELDEDADEQGDPVASAEEQDTSNIQKMVHVKDPALQKEQTVNKDKPFSVYAVSEGDFRYSDFGDGTAVITSYIGADKDIVIPKTLGELTVTVIGSSAFAGKQLTSVIIPDSVTSIWNYAFLDNELMSVEIPDSVISIEYGAFEKNKITSVTIPDSVTSIWNYAFAYNELTSVTIPDSITSIGRYAFLDNELTSITIPDRVTNIESWAFADNALTSVIIPNSVTSIEESAFRNNELTSFEIPDSVKSIGSSAFANNELTSIKIPNSVTSIGFWAFRNNELTSVIIPDSVTSIGDYAFANNELTSVIIPNSVISMGGNAFVGSPYVAIIGEEGSYADDYANANDIPFLNINDPFAFEFKPKGNEGKWVKKASTEVTVYGIGELELKYVWSTESTPPLLRDNWSPYDNRDEITQPDEGEWYLHIYVKDGNGDEKYGRSDLFQVDRTDPEIEISMTKGDGSTAYTSGDWSNEAINVSAEAKDTGSGLDIFEVSINGDKVDGIKDGKFVHKFDEEGQYKLSFKATDKVGNVKTDERTINIDQTKPSEPSIIIEPEGWTNAEKVTVTIMDGEDKENGSGIARTEYRVSEGGIWTPYASVFNITKEGETTVYARTIDHAGNESDIVQADVQIDRTAPELILLGANPTNLFYGESYKEPGYVVTDNFKKHLEVEASGEVNPTKIGSYELTYRVADSAGNETIVTRIVNVVDKEQPVITLEGDNPLTIEIGTPYEEPGATAQDNIDGDISDQIIIKGTVDTHKLGIYKVHYNVSDSSGNKAFEAVRTVRVVAPEVIFLGLDKGAIPVYAGSLVKVVNTNTTLQLPHDLPEGTVLAVKAVDISTKGYKQTGEMYNFVFTYPKGQEDYVGDFILTLGVNQDSENAAIYHYNEQTKRWNHVGGDITDGQISSTVNRFSIYGVLTTETDKPEEVPASNDEAEKDKNAVGLLPKTATNHYNWLLIGCVFIIASTILFWVNRRQKRVKEN